MAYLLFCLYFLLLLWAIPHLPICRKTGQAAILLRLFFALKVVAGVAYGYFHAQRGGGDTWMYHRYGLEDLDILRNDTVRFVTSIINPGYASGYGDFFGTSNSWWNDLDGHVFGKLLALADLITGSNYYINSLLFNLFSFTGTLLLLLVWQRVASAKKPLSAWVPFLIPSFIFWSSGIHKENLLVFALGLIIYSAYFGLQQQKLNLKSIAAVITGLLIVLVMRNFLLLPLCAGLFALAVSKMLQPRLHPLLTFTFVSLLAGVLFFTLHQFVPAPSLPQVVIDRQEAFNGLRSPNRFDALPLAPNAFSFLQNAPQALYNAAVRPMVWEAKDVLSLCSGVESLMILLLCAAALPFVPKSTLRNPLLLFCIFFSVSGLLIVGYTVVYPGAIVRYRSILLPLLVMPFVATLLHHSKLLSEPRNG